MNQLRKYLNGQMEAGEMEEYTGLLIQKKFDQDQKESWGRILKDQYGVERKNATKNKVRSLSVRWIVGIAASFLLIIVSFFIVKQSSESPSQQLADQYIETLSIMADQSVHRKGQFQEETTRIKANEAYINKDFEEAIHHWQELQLNGHANSYDLFYMGVSYLRQKKSAPEQTISLLETIKEQAPGLVQEINWVLSLAYIKSGQLDKARLQLEAIVDNEAYMDEAARKLLIALETE